MNSPAGSQQLYLRYLLDELSPDERAKVDEALIVDQGFSDSLQEARYDLIDAYVAKELSQEARLRVERAILSTKDGQEALSMALAMQSGKATPKESDTEVLTAVGVGHALAPVWGRKVRISLFVSTLAACFLLALGLFHVRQTVMRKTAQTLPLPSSATAKGAVPQNPGAAQLPVPPEGPPAAMHSAHRQSGVLAVAMPMGTVRGVVPVPIQLRRGIDRIEVQWPVPSDSTASAYTLEIASGQSSIAVLPQHGSLSPVNDLRVANFLLPVHTLPDGQYIFRLRAADVPGNTPVAESSVRISR
jgi:hypothetical protein